MPEGRRKGLDHDDLPQETRRGVLGDRGGGLAVRVSAKFRAGVLDFEQDRRIWCQYVAALLQANSSAPLGKSVFCRCRCMVCDARGQRRLVLDENQRGWPRWMCGSDLEHSRSFAL